MSDKIEVNVFNKTACRLNTIRLKNIICDLWKKFFPRIRRGYANFIFTTDSEIKELNSRYLNRRRTTDVISFYYNPQYKNPKMSREIEGDVFISLPQARRQAENLGGGDLSREILLLTIHGFLHLVGYRDYMEYEKKQMRFMEDKLLSAVKVKRLLSAR